MCIRTSIRDHYPSIWLCRAAGKAPTGSPPASLVRRGSPRTSARRPQPGRDRGDLIDRSARARCPGSRLAGWGHGLGDGQRPDLDVATAGSPEPAVTPESFGSRDHRGLGQRRRLAQRTPGLRHNPEFVVRCTRASAGSRGCSSIWLTAGDYRRWRSMTAARCSCVKFETPIGRTSPLLAEINQRLPRFGVPCRRWEFGPNGSATGPSGPSRAASAFP